MRASAAVVAVATVGVAVLLLSGLVGLAGVPTDGQATLPSVYIPGATPEVEISPEARPILEELLATLPTVRAYAATGTLRAEIDVGNTQSTDTATFATVFENSGRFRYELANKVVVGLTKPETPAGATPPVEWQAYLYLPGRNEFASASLPGGDRPLDSLPPFVTENLADREPTLGLLLSGDPRPLVLRGAVRVLRSPDSSIDGRTHPTIWIERSDGVCTTIAMSPTVPGAGALPRRITHDFSQQFRDRGTPMVRRATLVIEFTTVDFSPALAIPNQRFNWTAPEGATDLSDRLGPTTPASRP